jgi:hypothetical protein
VVTLCSSSHNSLAMRELRSKTHANDAGGDDAFVFKRGWVIGGGGGGNPDRKEGSDDVVVIADSDTVRAIVAFERNLRKAASDIRGSINNKLMDIVNALL